MQFSTFAYSPETVRALGLAAQRLVSEKPCWDVALEPRHINGIENKSDFLVIPLAIASEK